MDVEEPPEPIASDYVELASLILMFIVGGPLNLCAYTHLAERPSYTRLDILKRHLNYSDLLVLFIYVPSRACWLLTYDWRGGDFLCKVIKFLHTFTFQISSNVIVCIALDRLFSVFCSSYRSPDRSQRRTRIMLGIAWLAALIISTPQFAIWKSYLAFEELNWSQCMQIWEIVRAEAVLKNNTLVDAHILMDGENIYVVAHMALIFWVPALVVLVCYVIVAGWVWFNSRPTSIGAAHGSIARNNTLVSNGVSYHTGIDTVDSVLNRASEWKALRFLSKNPKTSLNFRPPNPKIVINDELMKPLADLKNNRSSITSCDTQRTSLNGQTTFNGASYNAQISRSRAIRVGALLVLAYIICWLPYNALSLIQFFDPALFNQHANKVYCLHGMMVFNSVVNPYLYGLFKSLLKLNGNRNRNDD
uniref:G_PROTEIN_RECEP_F1_2 domain-containing protein n=1 Tax=Steinernema glaseri TaxID=37863 RepID=A0A1I7YVA7_9BILA